MVDFRNSDTSEMLLDDVSYLIRGSSNKTAQFNQKLPRSHNVKEEVAGRVPGAAPRLNVRESKFLSPNPHSCLGSGESQITGFCPQST